MTEPALMSLSDIRDTLIPAAALLLPHIPFTDKSNVLLIAIGLQESRFRHRKQIRGPARGFWQFEAGGGTRGVLQHPRTRATAHDLTWARLKDSRPKIVNEALAEDDLLACCFARLLLWTDPRPLPMFGNAAHAWGCYEQNWRPGKPHRQTWDALYHQAMEVISEA